MMNRERVKGFSGQLRGAIGWVIAWSLIVGEASAQPRPEVEVKALWLVNIARFIEWPPSAEGTEDSLYIAVIGEGGVVPYLKPYQGKVINGRRIHVEYFDQFASQNELRRAKILYVSKSAQKESHAIFDFIKSKGVFTVGEQAGFIEQGGMMTLLLTGKTIRYELNRHAAAEERILIGARLLGRAARVIGAASEEWAHE